MPPDEFQKFYFEYNADSFGGWSMRTRKPNDLKEAEMAYEVARGNAELAREQRDLAEKAAGTLKTSLERAERRIKSLSEGVRCRDQRIAHLEGYLERVADTDAADSQQVVHNNTQSIVARTSRPRILAHQHWPDEQSVAGVDDTDDGFED